MFKVLEANTADELWLGAVALLTASPSGLQDSRNGPVLEIPHVGLSITDPRQRWIASRTPALNPAFAIAEVIWIMAGRDDADFLNYFNRKLPLYAGNTERYRGAYGQRLRKHFGFDQLERAFNVLTHNKDSRQVVLQIWDSTLDLPKDDGVPSSMDIPCNVIAMLKIRDGRLEWTQVMRSNDLFLGLPHNIVQFTTLQEVLAGWLNVEIGSYHHLSDSLHVYSGDFGKLANLQPTPPLTNTDRISLPKRSSEQCFSELLQTTEAIVNPSTESSVLLNTLDRSKLPESYRNLLSILVAEGIRRRRDFDLIRPAISFCSNLSLVDLFARWQARVADAASRASEVSAEGA